MYGINNMSEVLTSKYYDIDDFLKNYEELKTQNTTSNKLSKYEKTLILGLRAQQLTLMAQPLIDIPKNIDSVIEIAEMELNQRKLPFIIKRTLDTHNEFWKLEDMIY
jgi:DNA-directed RNA polymerase subunit K/omega